MLIVWDTLLVPEDQRLLVRIDPKVAYWPHRYVKDSGYNSCVPVEWWISFSASKYGVLWLLDHSQHSRVIYLD